MKCNNCNTKLYDEEFICPDCDNVVEEEFKVKDNKFWLRLYDEETGKARYAMISKKAADKITKIVWGK